MSHPLDGARGKLDRADEHLAALDAAVAAYLGQQPIQVEHRQEVDGRKRHIQWVATASTEPPATLGLIVGDWANNVRSALDYTVYELVRRETGQDDPRWTQFPIATDAAEYARQGCALGTRRDRAKPRNLSRDHRHVRLRVTYRAPAAR